MVVENSIHQIQKWLYVSFWVSTFVSAFIIFILLWLVNGIVISPLKQISKITNQLADDDLNVNIHETGTIYEISVLYKALAIFKNNALLKNEGSNILLNIDEQLQQQLELIEKQKREINLQAKAIEQSSKHKSEFIANMSHELRTLLNSVILLSDMLEDDLSDTNDENILTSLAYIKKGGRTLLAMVNDTLDLAKIEAGKMQRLKSNVTLTSAIEALLIEFKPQAQ